MQDLTTARLTSRLLSWGLPLFYFLTSIAFYLQTYDSAQVKITIVQMGGFLLIGLFYATLISRWGFSWAKVGPFVAPLIISLASGLSAWVFCEYPGNSLDETLRRIIYVHLALIALLEINTIERMRRMLKFLLAATAVASIYGLIQNLDFRFFPASRNPIGLDPFIWRQAFSDRIFSTFGNPNFFGNFLVIVTPITLALLLRRNREHPVSVLLFSMATVLVSAFLWQCRKMFPGMEADTNNLIFMLVLLGYLMFSAVRFSVLGALFFLITTTNFMTFSKGSMVGFAGSFISFLLLVLFFFSQFRSDRIRSVIRNSAWATLALVAITVGYYSAQRMDSLRFRLVTWTSTWEMAQMRPVLGNGIGSFRVLYPAFRRPQIFHIEGKHNTETDHAENEYLEVLMDEGLIGFTIFLWLITLFSAVGIRALGRFSEGLTIRDPMTGKRKVSDDPRAYYMLGLLAAFWGMLIHNLMDVSLRFVSSGIFLWLLMGLIGALVVHDPMADTDEHLELREGKAPPAQAPSVAVLVLAAVAGLSFLWLLRKIIVEFNLAQGPMPPGSGELLLWTIAWAAVLGALAWMVMALYRTLRSARNPLVLIALAALVYPLQVCWGYFMADVNHNRGIFFSKQGKWEDAIRHYSQTIALNPNYLMAYYFMGNVYVDRWAAGDFEKAMERYESLWKLAPNYVQSHHQAGLVHLKKAQDDRGRWSELRQQGKHAEASAALAKLKEDWNQALRHFEIYHMIDPVFEANFARAAWVHLQMAEIAGIEGNAQVQQRHYDVAEAQYKEALEAWGCRKPEHDMMGEYWERVHRHYERSYTGEMWENLGNVRFMRGHLSKAERAYLMALTRDPNNTRVLKNLANVYARLGRGADVQRLWARIRQIAPQDPDVQRVFSHGSSPVSRP